MLRDTLVPPEVPGEETEVLVVGEAPGEVEEKQRRPFVGPSGQVLRHFLTVAGYDMQKVAFANAVPFRPERNATPTPTEIETYKPALLDLINSLPNLKLIICTGGVPTQALLGFENILDARGYRTKVKFRNKEVIVGCTIHPALILRVPEFAHSFLIELMSFKKPYEEPTNTPFSLCLVPEDLKEVLDYSTIVLDLETTGFSFKHDRIICVGLGLVREDVLEKVLVLPLRVDKKEYWEPSFITDYLRKVVTNRTLIGYNIKFDVLFLATLLSGVFPSRVIDAMIGIKLVNENLNPRGAASLAYFAKVFTSLGWYEKDIKQYVPDKKKGTFEDIPRAALYQYLANDVQATFLAYELSQKALTTEKNVWDVLNKLTLIIAKSEFEGILIDTAKLDKIYAESLEAAAKIEAALAGYKINFKSATQVRKLLYEDLKLPEVLKTDSGRPSTSEAALERLKGKHPLVDMLLSYREKIKYTTIIKNLKEATSSDGRVHPSLNLVGTLTGRTSCSSPNLQQVPRDSDLRRVFIPGDGYLWVGADYDRAEMYMMALYSNCRALLQDLAKDVHTEVAIHVLHKKPEEIDESVRMIAKMVNFGILYGVTAKGLAERIPSMSEKQAQKVLDDYAKNYPEIFEFQAKALQIVKQSSSLQYFSGRKRHFLYVPSNKCVSELHRKAINSSIQGTVSDMTLSATVKTMEEAAAAKLDLRFLLILHDAAYFAVPFDKVNESCRLIKRCFESSLPNIKIPASLVIGRCWDDEESLEWSGETIDIKEEVIKKWRL